MAVLVALLAIGGALLALGAIGRAAPRAVPPLRTGLCLAGLAAALAAPLLPGPVATLELGAVFGLDGLGLVAAAALLLLSACAEGSPVVAGSLLLMLLAGDGITLLLALGAALLAGSRRGTGRLAVPALLAVALAALAWHAALPDPRFAAIRAMPPGTFAAVVVPFAALAGVVLLPLALPAPAACIAALYLAARLLLDLPGPITPGWWGVPTLAAGMAAALVTARRAAAADDLLAALLASLQAALGLALAGLGLALLARGADAPGLAALAVASAFLLAGTAALVAGLLLLAATAIRGAAGTTAIARLGGLLRRMPLTGLALLVGLASLASLPLTPGFAAAWWLLQALFGAARLGGSVVLALVAAALATAGLVVALLAAAALRLAGLVLLGAPRSAKAGAALEPRGIRRAALAVLALAALGFGLVPGLGAALVRPATRLLTGLGDGAGFWTLAAAPDAPGYRAIGVAALFLLCLAAAVRSGRGPAEPVASWRGGLPDPAPHASLHPVVLWPDWRQLRLRPTPGMLLMGLGLVLAAVLGWAAR